MDLDVYVKSFNVSLTGRSLIMVELSDVDKDDLDTKEVAACISIENFFETHDEDEIRRFVHHNYDWFDAHK